MIIYLLVLFTLHVQIPASLAPCPDSPNCVNTYQQTEGFERMEPLVFDGSARNAMNQLKAIIESMPRTELVADENDYLKVVFTIAVFGFKDDVEFLVDQEDSVINFRSASRTGYYDFGVNRSRMEDIREAWEERNKKD